LPDDDCKELLLRAVEAARLGVIIAFVVPPNNRVVDYRELMKAQGYEEDTRFVLHNRQPTWIYRGGGELTITTSVRTIREFHLKRMREDPDLPELEVVHGSWE